MSALAFAEEHGSVVEEHGAAAAEHHAAIPWSTLILPQTINFLIFAGILAFLLRKPVKEFFSSKGEVFLDSVRKAEEIKLQAEKAHHEIQSRLQNLEKNATVNVKDAEQEATVLREKLIREAKEAAVKTEQEAQRSVYHEHERAIAALRTELVTNSIRFAQDKVKSSTDSRVIEDLQQGFSKKVSEARQ
jgi:F-type H+-transporting ATPase subunit b